MIVSRQYHWSECEFVNVWFCVTGVRFPIECIVSTTHAQRAIIKVGLSPPQCTRIDRMSAHSLCMEQIRKHMVSSVHIVHWLSIGIRIFCAVYTGNFWIGLTFITRNVEQFSALTLLVGCQEGPVKIFWSEVQIAYIWFSWCHCHSIKSASAKSRMVYPGTDSPS